MILGSAWDLLGWLIFIILLSLALMIMLSGAWLSYRRVRDSMRDRWRLLQCSRERHGPNFIAATESSCWFDAKTNAYITEITRFQRCLRCFGRIEGSEITETRDVQQVRAIHVALRTIPPTTKKIKPRRFPFMRQEQ